MFDLLGTARSEFAFIDRLALARQFGEDGADAQFRNRVLAHLRPAAARSERQV